MPDVRDNAVRAAPCQTTRRFARIAAALFVGGVALSCAPTQAPPPAVQAERTNRPLVEAQPDAPPQVQVYVLECEAGGVPVHYITGGSARREASEVGYRVTWEFTSAMHDHAHSITFACPATPGWDPGFATYDWVA